MIPVWLRGLLLRRGARLGAISVGIAAAVALIGLLGSFIASSQATMTVRAAADVPVDWQVEVQPGGDPAAVAKTLRSTPGIETALPVGFARTTGFEATAAGSTQTTGPGVVLGLPDGYRAAFPSEIRSLSGSSSSGVLLAQQTAANLHVGPGDSISVGRPGTTPARIRVDAIVDLPQADSLFQRVGAPPQSQPTAPPDNVLLLPATTFQRMMVPVVTKDPEAVKTQFHVRRNAALPPAPAAAYTAVVSAAHNLEAQLAGAGVVGNNLGATLDAARSDAAYAQVLFLFLGLPGAVLAALLTAALVGAGATRRRREQALLRVRGLRAGQIIALASIEATVVGLAGGLLGVATAAIIGRALFGTNLGWLWASAAFATGLLIAAATVLLPAVRDRRGETVNAGRRELDRSANPLWARLGVDFVLIAVALLIYKASSGTNYALVLAPEGVATLKVSYWAFFGPALLWIGAALLVWRLATSGLAHGRRVLGRVVRPLTGELATTTAAGMSRQRGPLVRSVVLLALALSFAISTATFNATYRQQAEVDALLTNGADVTVTESPGVVVGPGAGSTITSVPGVRRVEPVQHRFAYVGSDLQDLYGVRPDTITDATSLQDAYFSGGTARQLMATLATRPDSILVSAETVTDFQLSPGDLLKLRLQDTKTKKFRTVPFHYAGIVKEFPTAPSDSFFVANAAYVARASGSDAVGAFLVDTGRTSQPAVADRVRHRLGNTVTVTDITQSRAKVGSSLTSVDLSGLTRFELVFAAVIAAAAGGLVLALGLAERRRAFAIVAVLGAKQRQLRGLVLSEAALVAIGGLLGGTLIAWALTRMLVKVLTGVFDPPPATIPVPWLYVSATVVAALAMITAGALLVVSRTTNRPPVVEIRDT